MHPSVASPSLKEDVKAAIDSMQKNQFVPIGEKDGSLRFFGEKLNDVEQERAQIPLRSSDVQRILNNALKDAFTPLPKTQLNGNRSVTSGVKTLVASRGFRSPATESHSDHCRSERSIRLRRGTHEL